MKGVYRTVKTYAIYDPWRRELIQFYRLKKDAQARWLDEWNCDNHYVIVPLTGTYALPTRKRTAQVTKDGDA